MAKIFIYLHANLRIEDIVSGNEINDKMMSCKIFINDNEIPIIIRKCGSIKTIKKFYSTNVKTGISIDVEGLRDYGRTPFQNDYVKLYMYITFKNIMIMSYIKKEYAGKLLILTL